jgi:hypothetical protein
MRAITRYFLLYLAFTSNVHAIVLGTVDEFNTYSSVGYTLTTAGGLGNVVALDQNWVLTAAHVVGSAPALLVMGDSFTGAEGAYIFFEEVITHPDYVPGEFHDDLALVKLSAFDPIIPPPGSIDASFATLSNVGLGGGEVVAGINSFIFDENDLLNPPGAPDWNSWISCRCIIGAVKQ